MRAFYNEFDPQAGAWLRELQADGLISQGVVDERSIKDVAADDVRGFGRAHFFAGIAGWELALQLAGWPAERGVWTGSCPCQPYSSAGKQRGDADERNLWPEFFRLIRECRPECVFGEQVASAIGHGWADRVRADLEGEGYAFGMVVLGAHSAGAPHIRQRMYWVAHAGRQQRERRADEQRPADAGAAERGEESVHDQRRGAVGVVGDADGGRLAERLQRDGEAAPDSADRRSPRADACGSGDGVGVALGDATGQRREGAADALPRPHDAGHGAERHAAASGEHRSFWADSRLVRCRDGKARRVPVEPALFPLAHGVPGRVGLLRGAGNAIVPQVAAEFVRAFLDEGH